MKFIQRILNIWDVYKRQPHGGPIVALMGVIEGILMFFVAIIAGSAITAVMVNVLKANKYKKSEQENEKVAA